MALGSRAPRSPLSESWRLVKTGFSLEFCLQVCVRDGAEGHTWGQGAHPAAACSPPSSHHTVRLMQRELWNKVKAEGPQMSF